MTTHSKGYAAFKKDGDLAPFEFDRREPKPNDIVIDIAYCGICHSDLHVVEDSMGMTRFPVVPGHEVVGHVTHVGPGVTRFKVGDRAAVGCYTDSCRVCEPCKSDMQHMCVEGLTGTFGGFERDGKQQSWGGFSKNYVIDQDYAYRIPDNLDLAAAAPLLCAGITTYSPLRKWGVGPGKKVGIVGLGGLGHMAVKLAAAMGADVTVFTGSKGKLEDAKKLGANTVILSSDPDQMNGQMGRFDFILDTVSAPHDIQSYVNCLKPMATLCLLGIDPAALSFSPIGVVFGQKCIAGSLIGGVNETQQMLDFCGEKNITADIELLPAQAINDAFHRLSKNDVKYRFVLDMAAL
ncbi:MAG: NAD(P)-dependent alcohol dehydrogenase [Caulobacterales bacterium]